MPLFRVIWQIDIEADDEQEAAEKALELQRDKYSTATLFSVLSKEKEAASYLSVVNSLDHDTRLTYDAVMDK